MNGWPFPIQLTAAIVAASLILDLKNWGWQHICGLREKSSDIEAALDRGAD